jgi:DNA-binding CsgD family transcriptional regulator
MTKGRTLPGRVPAGPARCYVWYLSDKREAERSLAAETLVKDVGRHGGFTGGNRVTPAERALRIGRQASHGQIAEELRSLPRRSVEGAILRTFTAGEPEASTALDALTRALTTPNEASPYVADRAIAMLLRRGHLRRAQAVIDAIPEVPAPLLSLRTAHIAVLAACQGRTAAAYDALASAEPEQEWDDLVTGILKERAAQAYLVLERYDLAMKRALSAVLHFEREGAKLMAALALRTPMRISHLVRGDVAAAREYAERALKLALEHGFQAHASETRSRLLLYAAELVDEHRYARSEREKSTLHFETIVARALHAITSGDIPRAHRELAKARIRDLRPLERLFCNALGAVCSMAEDDPGAGNAFVDLLLDAPASSSDLTQRRFAALSQGLAVAIAVAVERNDDARVIARRLHGSIEETFADYALGRAHAVPPALRAYAMTVDVVRRAKERRRPVHLTDAERRLIPLLSAGKDVKVIAIETKRSAATVRTHLEHIREKLGVTRSEDVAQRARDLGIA